MLSRIASLEEYVEALKSIKVPISKVENDITRKCQVQWGVARLDLLDKELSGNKLFKLLPFLLQARSAGLTELLSFGGVHSNHLHALAYAGKRFGFNVIAIVRGYVQQAETPTLADLRRLGVQVEFAGKSEYLRRYDQGYLQDLGNRFPSSMIIPEGGSHALGIEGSQLLAKVVRRSLNASPDYLALATGTGTTFAGVLTSGEFDNDCQLHGFAALKNSESLQLMLQKMVSVAGIDIPHYMITDEFSGGKFAGLSNELALFMAQFESEQHILLDPVYTAKLFFAIYKQIEKGIIPPGSNVVTLHTGGLQGRRGMQEKLAAFGVNESMSGKYCYG